MNVAYHQHNKDRVLFPLKKVGDGFERISWDRAVSEISERLKGIIDQYGPRTIASLTGGGEFSFLSASFPIRMVRRLGSRYKLFRREPGIFRPVLGARTDIGKPEHHDGT